MPSKRAAVRAEAGAGSAPPRACGALRSVLSEVVSLLADDMVGSKRCDSAAEPWRGRGQRWSDAGGRIQPAGLRESASRAN